MFDYFSRMPKTLEDVCQALDKLKDRFKKNVDKLDDMDKKIDKMLEDFNSKFNDFNTRLGNFETKLVQKWVESPVSEVGASTAVKEEVDVSTEEEKIDKEVAIAKALEVRAQAKALEVRAKAEACAKAEARGIRFQSIAKAEALAEARIEASKAKAVGFANFLKAERKKHRSGPKFAMATNLVIKPSTLDVKSPLQEDSTPAIKLGDNSKEVESVGIMLSKLEVKSVELCSEKDICKEVESVGVMPSKVEKISVELCSKKDSTPAPDSGVMPSKVEEINVELCSKGNSIPFHSGIIPSNVEGISVELCSKGGSSTALREDSIPASPTNLGVMPIKTDSEKMVAPSNNGYRIISSQAIRMGVIVKLSVFDDLLSSVCKTFGTYIAPITYLKSCLLISPRKPLAFKGGG